MQSDWWWVVTILCSWVGAAYFLSNDIFKLKGQTLVFWRSFAGVLIILFFLPFVEWPQSTTFYWQSVVAALFSAVSDIFMFNAIKNYGGAAVSRFMGVRPVFLFLLWPLFLSGSFSQLLESPLIGIGIFLCLVSVAVAFYFMRKNNFSRVALIAVSPVIVLLCLSDIYHTLSVHSELTFDRVVILSLIFCLVMLVVSGGYALAIGQVGSLCEGRWIVAGGVNGALFVALLITKTSGLSMAGNPAYFNALFASMAFWVFLVHRYILKRQDNANPALGFVIVVSGVILTLLVYALPK